jgi:hypothetical protein
VGSVVTVNSQRKSIKSQTNPIKIQIFLLFKIGFVFDFIDFVREFTVKTTKQRTQLPAMKAVTMKNFNFVYI